MNLSTIIPHRTLLKLQLPVLLLVTLLQRTPLLRVLAGAAPLSTAAPGGQLLRSAMAAAASLGALHSLAGATTLVSSAPGPVSARVGTTITPIGFTVTDTINIASWRIGGTIPPGLTLDTVEGGASLTSAGLLDATGGAAGGGSPSDDPYYGGGAGGGGVMSTTPLLKGTPTTAGNYTMTLQAFEFSGATGLASRTFDFVINVAAAPATTTAPAFAKEPAAQTAAVGGTITLTAEATGNPAPTYQWLKNGAALTGATNATLTLTQVTVADAGSYAVRATNSAGNVTTPTVVVTITTPPPTNTAPAIARQPAGRTVATGSTAVFSVEATGTPAPTYQWRRGNTPIPGATSAVLVINKASAADAGSYTAVVTNSVDTVTTTAATLALSNDSYFGHLLNLSIRTSLTTAVPDFTVGTVVGGAGTAGSKALLARAVGPSLVPFGLTDAVTDSKIELVSGTTVVGSNDNWGGAAAIAEANAAVGAFAFASASSKDAAIYNPTTASGGYTLNISGVGNATGTVLAELYDATAASAFTAATPRLINVSVRKQIAAGEILTAGFVVGGNTARTVLIRAVGPTLAAFGVPGTMGDPKLELYSGASVLAANDNWGGDAQLSAVCAAVGAFGFSDNASKDAMLVVTLPPGAYTAQVSGGNNTSGSALVEIYEVP